MAQNTLCNTHNDIIYDLDVIKKELKNIGVKSELVYTLIKETRKKCAKAKVMGQHMENRMRRYRNSIESLGFIRNDG